MMGGVKEKTPEKWVVTDTFIYPTTTDQVPIVCCAYPRGTVHVWSSHYCSPGKDADVALELLFFRPWMTKNISIGK